MKSDMIYSNRWGSKETTIMKGYEIIKTKKCK